MTNKSIVIAAETDKNSCEPIEFLYRVADHLQFMIIATENLQHNQGLTSIENIKFLKYNIDNYLKLATQN